VILKRELLLNKIKEILKDEILEVDIDLSTFAKPQYMIKSIENMQGCHLIGHFKGGMLSISNSETWRIQRVYDYLIIFKKEH